MLRAKHVPVFVARERTPSAGIDAVRAAVDEFKTTYTHHKNVCTLKRVEKTNVKRNLMHDVVCGKRGIVR